MTDANFHPSRFSWGSGVGQSWLAQVVNMKDDKEKNCRYQCRPMGILQSHVPDEKLPWHPCVSSATSQGASPSIRPGDWVWCHDPGSSVTSGPFIQHLVSNKPGTDKKGVPTRERMAQPREESRKGPTHDGKNIQTNDYTQTMQSKYPDIRYPRDTLEEPHKNTGKTNNRWDEKDYKFASMA